VPAQDPRLARGWRLIGSIDSGDPVALSRLDALLVELTRTSSEEPELLRLRTAYAVRQWGRLRGTVIVRSNQLLLQDLDRIPDGFPEEKLAVAVLAAVEKYCGEPPDPGAIETRQRIREAAHAYLRQVGGEVLSAKAERFAQLVAAVMHGERSAQDAVKAATRAGLPALLVMCVEYTGRMAAQWRLAALLEP
jgi:hypothetical protein